MFKTWSGAMSFRDPPRVKMNDTNPYRNIAASLYLDAKSGLIADAYFIDQVLYFAKATLAWNQAKKMHDYMNKICLAAWPEKTERGN